MDNYKRLLIVIVTIVIQLPVLGSISYAQNDDYDLPDIGINIYKSELKSRSVDDIHSEAAKDVREGNYDAAIDLLDYIINRIENNPAVKLSNYVPKIYSNRARAKLFNGDFYGALEDANRAVKLAGERAQRNKGYRHSDSYIFFNRGMVRQDMRRNKKALGDYNTAIALNPNIGYYYNDQGIVLLRLGRENEACKSFRKAIDMGVKESKKPYNSVCQ